MNIIDRIFPNLRRRHYVIGSHAYDLPFYGIGCKQFGETVFLNIVEILTDLANDVTWVNQGRDAMRFAEFRRFFEDEAMRALWLTYRRGFAVVGIRDDGFIRLLDRHEWNERQTADRATEVFAIDKAWQVYVMKSTTFANVGKSDYDLCRPFIDFLDNTLNASNTATERMGAMVVASPETAGNAPTATVLNERDKKDMEETIGKEYGLLSRQRQIMLLPRSMRFDTINLTGIDTRLNERVRVAVLAICDRIKVPANQVAIIDAESSKTLSNGSELREGDFNKYQSFERLLNRTFVKMANDIGLNVDYAIYNKPDRNGGTLTEAETLTTQTIEQ